jgi:hypothetical protein
MVLISQIAAVLVACAFLSFAVAKQRTPAAIARSIFVLASLLAYLYFWAHAWSTPDSYWSQRSAWKRLTPDQAVATGGAAAEGGLQTGFAEWIRSRLKPGERFYLEPSGARDDPAVYQWFTYRLLPNLTSEAPKQADWFVFYNTSPKASGVRARLRGADEQYAPNFSIARVRHAS